MLSPRSGFLCLGGTDENRIEILERRYGASLEDKDSGQQDRYPKARSDRHRKS